MSGDSGTQTITKLTRRLLDGNKQSSKIRYEKRCKNTSARFQLPGKGKRRLAIPNVTSYCCV